MSSADFIKGADLALMHYDLVREIVPVEALSVEAKIKLCQTDENVRLFRERLEEMRG